MSLNCSLKYWKKELGLKKNDDDLILIGCSPCQYWSVISNRQTKIGKIQEFAFRVFQRFVEYFNPGYVVVENVPGILSRMKESGLDNFIKLLEEKGFTVHFGIHNTADYGIPQSRKRFTLIANRITKEKLEPVKYSGKRLTVRDVLGMENGFPKIVAGHQDETDFMHSCAGLSDINLKRLALIPKTEETAWLLRIFPNYS